MPKFRMHGLQQQTDEPDSADDIVDRIVDRGTRTQPHRLPAREY